MCELHNLRHLNIKDNTFKKYYIAVKESILSHLKGNCTKNVEQLIPGMLVEALNESERENNEDLVVRVYTENKSDAWYQTEWKGHQIDLFPISELIWKLLCPILDLKERLKIAKNKELCQDVEKIKTNSHIWYTPDLNKTSQYSAIVKSIGEVHELGDGFYFALDLSNNPEIFKPSLKSKIYNEIYKSIGIFATLSYVSPHKKNSDSIRIFEKNFIQGNLQSKNTNNFFVKNKENIKIIDSKKNLYHQKDKYSLYVDSDNNNQATRLKLSSAFNTSNESSQIVSLKHENENKKQYSRLKSFDPLNSDNEMEEIPKYIQQASNATNLRIGSHVKVVVNNDTHHGVVRGLEPPSTKSSGVTASIEFVSIHPQTIDGTYENTRYIECGSQKTLFTDLKDCHQYDMAVSSCYYKPETEYFEFIQNSVVSGPISSIPLQDLNNICGKHRGIQGHHNSCYLDATLFSMFAFTDAFDSLLFRPQSETDCPEYEEVQRVLREEIVKPLRKDFFVPAYQVMSLRTLLEKSSSVSGLTCDEKDPEEFLTSLVAQTLKAEPYLKLSSGQDAYHYQLFVEKDDQLTFPTVQQLLEQSFLTSNIKLKEVPSILILQMPRFGKSYKMYSKIKPTLMLDVTDIIEDSARQCTVCGGLATFECRECYGQRDEGLQSIAFCESCLEKAHSHETRSNNHHPKILNVSTKYEIPKDCTSISRLYLELLAVVCIETSHYVSFVKCAPGADAPWCFFDSMADRKGEQNGYNIPEVVPLPNFAYWLSDDAASTSVADDRRQLPEHVKRLLCDAYMCMYQSCDEMTYKGN